MVNKLVDNVEALVKEKEFPIVFLSFVALLRLVSVLSSASFAKLDFSAATFHLVVSGIFCRLHIFGRVLRRFTVHREQLLRCSE